MGESGAVVIAFMLHKDLGLVLEAAEGGGGDDPVAVACIAGPCGAFGLGMEPAAALGGLRGEGRKRRRSLENRADQMSGRRLVHGPLLRRLAGLHKTRSRIMAWIAWTRPWKPQDQSGFRPGPRKGSPRSSRRKPSLPCCAWR